jgi:hypothetical protein
MVVQSSIGEKSKNLRILDDQKRSLLGRLDEYIEVPPLSFFGPRRLRYVVAVFFVLCLLGAIVGGATFYFPITDLGVSEAYGTLGASIQTEVWLKVVITPLLGAVVFALLDIGWQLKEARQDNPDMWK